MTKVMIGSVMAALVVAPAAIDGRGVVLPGISPAFEPESIRNLLLNAAGRRTPKPEQIRIPILVEGAEYEVTVAKPGEPRLIHVK